MGFGVLKVEIVSAKTGSEPQASIARDWRKGEMCLLFFGVLINLGVVSDQRFNRGELSWNGGQSNPPEGKKQRNSDRW